MDSLEPVVLSLEITIASIIKGLRYLQHYLEATFPCEWGFFGRVSTG